MTPEGWVCSFINSLEPGSFVCVFWGLEIMELASSAAGQFLGCGPL